MAAWGPRWRKAFEGGGVVDVSAASQGYGEPVNLGSVAAHHPEGEAGGLVGACVEEDVLAIGGEFSAVLAVDEQSRGRDEVEVGAIGVDDEQSSRLKASLAVGDVADEDDVVAVRGVAARDVLAAWVAG